MTRFRGRGLAAALLLASACAPPPDGAVPAKRPPVVLVSIDTLRSDRLPVYGYDGIETPAIDALRREAILFRHAFSPVPLTLPAHASALTGLLPAEHGVRDNMGYRLDPEAGPWLPRMLRELGYATGAAVSSFVLRGTSGIAADFDLFDDRIALGSEAQLSGVQRRGRETLGIAREWLRSVGPERPFFLFFHIYEPHAPHDPPEPYASRYADPYDAEVALADEIVGSLLETLRTAGRFDEAVILLMSDHGEGLGDHGYQEHGVFLYREALQVPLLLKLPGSRRAGETVEVPAQLTDLLPTVAALVGVDPPPGLGGSSLLDLPRLGPRPLYGETLYPRIHYGWSDLASVIAFPYQLIDGPSPELFDLARDPAQLHDLIREERPRYTELQGLLQGYDHSFRPPAEEDPETRRRLAALGYLGGSAAATEGPLPDPKSRIGSLAVVSKGVTLFRSRRYAEAIAAFERGLAEEPGMVDAWEMLGSCLMEVGRTEDAIDAFEEAMDRSGGAPHVALAAADAYLRAGRLEEARTHAEIALAAHELAHGVLAQIHLALGDEEAAREHNARALAIEPTRLAALITEAHLELRAGNPGRALELIRRAEAEHRDTTDRRVLRGLYFLRGRAHSALGDTAAAEAAFRQEIELSPGQLAAYTHLAYLYALENRGPEAGASLQRMVEANPTPHAYAEAVRTLRAMGDPSSAAAVLRQARRRWPENDELAALASG